MSASTRRRFVSALLGMGITAALGPLLRPLHAAANPPLRLPDQPLRLLRVLERGMGTGETGDETAAIIVQRSWEVRFERQARGIIASGRQISTEVSAPPQLAELARIEQQRDASAIFPLMLSESGALLTPAAASGESDAVAAALRAAEALIARQPLPAAERARIGRYLAEVHRAGASLLETLPDDLLFPAGVPINRRETVALPDGLTGEFALHYEALPQADAPWLARAERRVVTTVKGRERRSAEVWTLGPL